MATTIKFKRGTRANLNSLATSNLLVAGEPILITDEDRIAICASDSTYEEFAKVSEVVSSGMTNPMTTSGDIIYGGSSGIPTRLPKGSDGQVLSLVSGIPAWATASSSGTSLWTAIAGTRVSNTSFTVGSDITTFATKGLIFKWTESDVVRCAMVTSSSYSSPNTTVNIVGDTMASIDSGSLKYTFMPVQKYEWRIAGTIGATGTNIAQIHYVREPMRVIGGEISTNVAGTTNSTTVNIVNSNGTVTLISPTLATTVANNTTVTAPATSGLSLAINDKLTESITAIQTTPCVDLYVDLLVFPTRFLNLT